MWNIFFFMYHLILVRNYQRKGEFQKLYDTLDAKCRQLERDGHSSKKLKDNESVEPISAEISRRGETNFVEIRLPNSEPIAADSLFVLWLLVLMAWSKRPL